MKGHPLLGAIVFASFIAILAATPTDHGRGTESPPGAVLRHAVQTHQGRFDAPVVILANGGKRPAEAGR
jgi:hypothetical protein